jgi:AcrR family transcriptional regulator
MSDSKEHILNAAFRLFLKKSFKDVTMKELVRETGLSKGAFYHYFESKEQLFSEMIQKFMTSMMDINFDRFSRKSLYEFYHDYLDDQNAMTNAFIRQVSKNSGDSGNFNYFTLFFDAMKLIPGTIGKFKKMNESEIATWASVVSAAKKSGEIRTAMTDEQVGRFFHQTEQGLSMQLILEERIQDWKKDVTELWDAFYLQLKV